MEKQLLIIIGVIALLVCIGLCGCNQVNNTINPEKNKFVGTWQNTTLDLTTTINLFSDGTCLYLDLPGTWDVKDGKLIMDFTDSGFTWTYNYVFSNNDRTLSLTFTAGGLSQVFIKQ
ncbi:Uncharacterised protein [uncultured archaeon]|nr:Uncharacterised protein [uncultured archaeon]